MNRPPASMIGIGRQPCSEYVQIYDAYQKVLRREEADQGQVVAAVGAFANFEGTFGGYLARVQMEEGLQQPPFNSKDDAMKQMYQSCKISPNARFIDAVDAVLLGVMSQVKR